MFRMAAAQVLLCYTYPSGKPISSFHCLRQRQVSFRTDTFCGVTHLPSHLNISQSYSQSVVTKSTIRSLKHIPNFDNRPQDFVLSTSIPLHTFSPQDADLEPDSAIYRRRGQHVWGLRQRSGIVRKH